MQPPKIVGNLNEISHIPKRFSTPIKLDINSTPNQLNLPHRDVILSSPSSIRRSHRHIQIRRSLNLCIYPWNLFTPGLSIQNVRNVIFEQSNPQSLSLRNDYPYRRPKHPSHMT